MPSTAVSWAIPTGWELGRGSFFFDLGRGYGPFSMPIFPEGFPVGLGLEPGSVLLGWPPGDAPGGSGFVAWSEISGGSPRDGRFVETPVTVTVSTGGPPFGSFGIEPPPGGGFLPVRENPPG